MNTFLMIIVVAGCVGGAISVTTAEFTSKFTCEQAAPQIRKMRVDRYTKVTTTCVRK